MTTVPAPTFGDLLRRHRKAAGLSQEELAERAHLSPRTLSDLERGVASRPYRDTVGLLAEALGLAGAERARFEAAARSREVPPAEPQDALPAQGTSDREQVPAGGDGPTAPELPTGTLTFLLTDIEGSTAYWDRHPAAMQVAIVRHDALMDEVLARYGGRQVKERGEGDSILAVFTSPRAALAAVCALQRALGAEPWPPEVPLRVRMGLHTGEADLRGSGYYGATVNRTARIRSLAHGGQVLLSRSTHDLVLDGLPEEVGLRSLGSYPLKGLERAEEVFQVLHPDLPADFPPLASPQAPPTNLPAQLTSFIGREREQAEVRALLGAGRLVTLTGPGGVGKTRLALAVAGQALSEYADGVWLVELAALSDPALVPQAVAQALGLRETPGQPMLSTLLEYLATRRLLLVLDNCEHLVAACAELVAALLRGCPDLRILATSREGLGVAGERLYRVPSLPVPTLDHLPPPEQLGEYAGVALFVARARERRADFALTPQNARTVAQICARLDGMPLALELAAARVGSLPVEAIAARLDDRFRLLSGGPRGVLPRQQTLRAALDWSYDLLAEPEQRLLYRLSVFAGGWTLGAAEAVCAGDGVEAWEVLDLLGGLVNKSLVLLEEAGPKEEQGRFRLLETVRQYGWERLRASDEAARVRDRHLDWCVALGEQAEPGLWGSEEGIWLDRLEAEHENLRAALRWSLDEGNKPSVGVQLAVLTRRFWSTRGYLSEGRMWLERALTWEDSLPPALRARALSAAGGMAWGQSDLERARILLGESVGLRRALGDKEGIAGSLYSLGLVADDLGDRAAAKDMWLESLTISQESGDKRGIAAALGSLATAASMEGDFEQAMQLHRQSLALRRDLGNELEVAYSLGSLGNMASSQGDYEQAGALYRECLAVLRRLGNRAGMASALGSLGNTAYARDEYQQAGLLYEESLALRRAVGDQLGIATSLGTLGDVALAQGEHDRAAALFAESLALLQRLDIRPAVASPLAGMARLALVRGHAQAAARVLGAVDALHTEFAIRLDPHGLASHDRLVTAAREALGLSAFDEAWLAGQAMPLELAIALALEVNPAT